MTRRWWIAVSGTVLQLCLGTVYAWSYFQNPLTQGYGWSETAVSGAFSIAICFLGLAAAWGGLQLPKVGPRRLAMLGGILFGVGYLLAGAALHFRMLPLLYLGYGVIGGIGLGLGYVTPVATVAKWFPDKKGLVTGMVIMGFGFGALLMSKLLAPALESHTDGNLVAMFIWLGVVFTAVTVLAGSRLQNPPPGFPPAGFSPAGFPRQSVDTATEADAGRVEPDRSGAESSLAAEASERDPAPMSQTAHAGKALRSRSFAMMWLIFFCNIIAGIAIIGFQSPLMQDLWRLANASLPPQKVAAFGATLIAVSSVFNGLGRMLWGAISDHIGRIRVFRIMLGTQIAVFGALMITTNPWVFGALVCYVLLCYGGGFGCMPSFVQDTFGEKLMPLVYGCILTAWSAAGLLGPPLLGVMRDHAGVMAARYSFMTGAAFLSVGLIVALFSRWPSGKTVCQ